jgi:hypothetical protein
MKMTALFTFSFSLGCGLLCPSCKSEKSHKEPIINVPVSTAALFGDDLEFLKKHTQIHTLSNEAGAQVAVAPAWQGRVMTSSAEGLSGASLGWIHRENIRTGILPPEKRSDLAKHIHIFGGEERFWLGPEGGQFALFFPPDSSGYDFAQWKTPAIIDTEAFDIESKDNTTIKFRKDAVLQNRKGTSFQLRIQRTVEILPDGKIPGLADMPLPEGVKAVAYRTHNEISNEGTEAWTREGGLISIWLLGMYPHSANTTVVVPLKDGPGPAVNADYFGELDSSRLTSNDKAVFFKGDGAFRSKIGVPPGRSTGIAGSYDPIQGNLTIVACGLPENAADLPYVRSQWMDHKEPYAGDLINAYNDGSPTPDEAPLGPFYELETSSPALPLQPKESIRHIQTTAHYLGTPQQLEPMARKLLGVSLEEITSTFAK